MLTNQDILVFYRFFFYQDLEFLAWNLTLLCQSDTTAAAIQSIIWWWKRVLVAVHESLLWLTVANERPVYGGWGVGGARMKTMPDSVRRLVCWPAPTALHRRQGVNKLKVDPGWIVSKLHQIRHYVCSPLPIHKSSVKPMRWRVFRDMRATDRQGFLSQLDC